MRLLLALLASALLPDGGACSAQAAAASAAPPPAAASSAARDAPAGPVEFRVEGRSFVLRQEGGSCEIDVSGPNPLRLTLALAPPCHVLTWRMPPPAPGKRGPSDGRPVGAVGEPMAWRYPSAGGVVALAVIGDAVAEPQRSGSLYRLRERQGLHCAGSVQGLLIERRGGGGVRLSPKRAQVGVLCAEIGLEEKDFWILAHR